jgi:1-acyl-sn-glycerol-3-phosphate acyltransferase
MTDHARGYARLAAAFLWTVPLFFLRQCVRPLHAAAHEFERTARGRIMQIWSRGILRILNVHLVTRGTPPRGHYYIVANHMSYLDIAVFARRLGCVFVAMSEMAEWPLLGFAVRNMNTIFINRKDWREVQRVNDVIGAALAAEHGVMVFPESTTSYGHDVLPFRPALLEAAVAVELPVYYATLRYHRTEACPNPERDVCWVDDVPFVVHALRLLRVPRIDATIVFGDAPISAPGRKLLARELENAVRGQVLKFDVESGENRAAGRPETANSLNVRR